MSVLGHFFLYGDVMFGIFYRGVTVWQEGVDSAPTSSPPPHIYYWFYSVEVLVIVTS